MYDVTSWFQAQMVDEWTTSPKRILEVGNSDYSDYVVKWPKIKRTGERILSTRLTIPLENVSGDLNDFYTNTYTIPLSGAPRDVVLKMGFTHPDSGDELVTLFTGALKNVKYVDSQKQCHLKVYDKLWELTNRKVGDSDAPVSFSAELPSDIAWTLLACYGGLVDSQDNANEDIDWAVFQEWAIAFSADNVDVDAYYDGQKVTEAIERLCKMTDSIVWVEGDGKLNFRRFEEASSLDLTITEDEYSEFGIDVETLRLVNKQWVYWNYSIDSDYFASKVFNESSVSVDSFGLHEAVLEDESIWFTDSVDALTIAQRKTLLLDAPPRRFKITTDLYAMRAQLGETIRLVNDFYNVDSSQGWRMTELGIDMDTGRIDIETDEATTANAFYLDVSCLDGDDLLL